MNRIANVARIAMWVMILAIVLGFFVRGPWIRIIWAVAAAVCVICILIVAYNKNKGGR